MMMKTHFGSQNDAIHTEMQGCDWSHAFFTLHSTPFRLEPHLVAHPLVNTFHSASSGNLGKQFLQSFRKFLEKPENFIHIRLDDRQLTGNVDEKLGPGAGSGFTHLEYKY